MSNQNIEFKDSQIAWIGQIPKHWEITKNKYILNGVYSGGTPTSGTPEFYTDEDNGIPFVSIGDMSKKEFIESTKTKVTKLGIRDKNLKILTKNTILYSIYATIGEVAELKCNATISQALLALFVKNSYDKQFYKYNLKAMKDYIFFQSNGNTQFNLNANKVINFHFLLPPLNEQEKIANFLDNKCEKIDNTIKNLEQKISNLKEYKKSLINQCVTKGLDPKTELKDSGVKWIGKIPKHWEISRIKYNFDFSSGLNITKENLIESGIPVISYGQIHSKENTGTFIKDSFFRFISQDYLKNKKSLVNKGNFIFADTSEDLDGAGNSVFVNLDLTMFAGYHTIILKNKYNFEFSKFLSYLFQTDLWRSQIRLAVSGVKVFSITKKILAKCEILVPPLNEQKEIAEFLDKKCEKIDRLNENYTKQITALKEYKKSLIYECVTGKKEI